MGVLGQNGGDFLGLGDGEDFCLRSYYVSGQNGVGKPPPPHHSSGLAKFSLGSGPWHGLFVGQDLSEGLEGDQGTGMMSVWGACFWKDQAALSMPFPSVSASPTPSLPRTVGLDTGGHAGEARVHVRGEGPLAADLLLGFWKEGETEGRGYQGRVGRRGKKGKEMRERRRQRQREVSVGVVGWSCLGPSIFWGAGVELVSMVDFVSVGQNGVEGRVPQTSASL